MLKKSLLAVFAAALAFAALPALAAASPNPYLAENGTAISGPAAFTISGAEGILETTGGNFVKCKKTSGEGEFTNAETGKIKVIFHECSTVFGITCTTSGQPSGTITTPEALPFHLKTVEHEGQKKAGVLITPTNTAAHEQFLFAKFSCSFVGAVEVTGNGLVGTIENKEEEPSNTANILFQKEKEKPGHQTHRKVTNDSGVLQEYDLKSSVNGGTTETASEEATGTITFANNTKPEIRTTAE